MSKKIAFIFPGQGAQYPSMGRDFFDTHEAAKEVFVQADAILGKPFSELIFNGSAEELTLTKNSQLAIFIVSMAILRVVEKDFPSLVPSVCSGLSLGEYTALVAASVLSFEEALLLVRERGELMHTACETHPGTMNVVLGLDLATVETAIRGIDGVWIANLNCPGQIVIAGTKEGIAKAADPLKAAGARRVLPLEVSGAFHSGLMQQAQDQLTPLIQEVTLKESSVSVVMNVPGNFTSDPSEIRSNMSQQVTSPVCWQKGIEVICEQGIELFIEMGPGKSLAGMNKRIGVKVPTISIEKVDDLSQLHGVSDAAAT